MHPDTLSYHTHIQSGKLRLKVYVGSIQNRRKKSVLNKDKCLLFYLTRKKGSVWYETKSVVVHFFVCSRTEFSIWFSSSLFNLLLFYLCQSFFSQPKILLSFFIQWRIVKLKYFLFEIYPYSLLASFHFAYPKTMVWHSQILSIFKLITRNVSALHHVHCFPHFRSPDQFKANCRCLLSNHITFDLNAQTRVFKRFIRLWFEENHWAMV